MTILRKRAASENRNSNNGLYVHSNPPRILSVSASHIRQLIRNGDIEKLEQVVLDGQGKKLIGEYSADYKTRTFLKSVPALMSKISLLHDALNSDRLAEIQSILDEEPERKKKLVLAKDESGVGLLHKAIYYDLKSIFRWLIDKFPHTVHSKDSEGRTPYFYTLMCKDPGVVQKLLTVNGADPNVQDNLNHTTKFYNCHPQELELPNNSHKSRKSTSRKNTGTSSSESLNYKKSNIRIWIHQRNMTNLQQLVLDGYGSKLLVEHSNNPKMRKFLDSVPYLMGVIKDVHCDAQNGDLDSLINRVSPPVPIQILTAKDANGLTPLHKAVGLGKTDIVHYIVEKAPNSVQIVDNEGRTPLHYAALLKADNQKMFNYLIEHDADESALDNRQKTAAYYKTRNSELDTKVLHIIPECPRGNKEPHNFEWNLLNFEPVAAAGAAISGIGKKIRSRAEENQIREKTATTTSEEEKQKVSEILEENHSPQRNGGNIEKSPRKQRSESRGSVSENLTSSNNAEKPSNNGEEQKNEEEEEDAPPQEKKNNINDDDEPNNKEIIKANDGNEAAEFVEENNGIKDHEEKNEDNSDDDHHNEEAHFTNNNEAEMSTSTIIEQQQKNNQDNTNTSANNRKSRTSSAKNSATTERVSASSSSSNNIEENETERSRPQSSSVPKYEEFDDGDEEKNNNLEFEGEGVIEGIVNGEHEVESTNNEGQKRPSTTTDDVGGESNNIIGNLIDSGNMEQLAALVLNGEGEKLIGESSDNAELQAFLENVPIYMSKINRIHGAAREGNLRDLQAALDRRKFAIAKDKISSNGATPLHVAVAFSRTSVVRYLAGRFPETLNTEDDNGRTPLHYAAVLKDNGHYYNLLTHLGANNKIKDKFDHTPIYYTKIQTDFNHRQILADYGVEISDEATDMMESSSNKDNINNIEDNKGQIDMPFFATEEGRYLASSLGDPLIKGLTEVANKRPEDPIAYLATYLYNFAKNTHHGPSSSLNNNKLMEKTSSENYSNPIDVVTIEPPEENDLEPDTAFKSASRDEHGQSMIHFAAARSHGRNALFQLLLESEINIAYRDELYRTARDISMQANVPENTMEIDKYVVHIATLGDNNKLVELLLEGYDHITDIILDNNPIIDIVSETNQSPETVSFLQSILAFEEKRERVHHAIRQGLLTEVMNLLADENDTGSGKLLAIGKNNYGRCSLHIAVLCQQEEIVDYLAITFRDTLHIGDNLERTALHYAMGVEKMETITKVLIKAGAKRVVKDLKGRQSTYYYLNKSDIVRLQEEEETI